jgi:hypothetical protein
VLFPLAEVGDKILTNLLRHVLADVGIKGFPLANGVKVNQADGKQLTALLFPRLLSSVVNFGLDSFTHHCSSEERIDTLYAETAWPVLLPVYYQSIVRGEIRSRIRPAITPIVTTPSTPSVAAMMRPISVWGVMSP